MSQNSDATHAYRGYRLQALYTLNRILNQELAQNVTFQPEGKEDLAIFDLEDNLLEITQVKERTQSLSLSSFEPEKEDSFFYRIAKEITIHPTSEVNIIAFGNVGAEIKNAIQDEGIDRKRVVKKLSNYGKLSELESQKIFEKIGLILADETDLTKSVFSKLQNSLVGINPEISFDLLMQWLFISSEQKTKITRQELIDKITNIGSFLSARTAFHKQWFTTIIPIDDFSINDDNKKELEKEFYKGVSARYEHILANVDVIRNEKIQEISESFKEKRIVIIHAASGQGKTTLAYRYLYEYFPQEWRFRIKAIVNREHALNVALALSSHADAIGVPMAIYIDVSAQDRDWTELVKQLSVYKSIKIIVTIREEDWRRANITNTDFDFQNIELSLNREEARQIYNSLTNKVTPVTVLDFEDAWNKFGESGPLMEFIYLVTQGSSLQDRLSQQINFLEDEVRQGKLDETEFRLLRITAVASAYEARLQLKPIVQYLHLTAPRKTLDLFEKEYLLRVSENGELVSGLHPIRSEILSKLLCDPTFSSWSETAGECLEFIQEEDLEIFLLYSFSRHFDEAEKLLQKLSLYQPKSWLAIAGVIRALIWLGLAEYIRANQEVIEEATKKLGKGGWSYFLDFDIAEVIPDVNLWWKNLNLFPKEIVETIENLLSRQTNKKDVFIQVTKWLKNRTESPISPNTEADWEAFAEVVFWLKKLGVIWNLQEWFSIEELNNVSSTLSIETLANVVYSLSSDGRFDTWIVKNNSIYLKRFREEFLIVGLEGDKQKISAHYIFDFSRINENSSGKNDKQTSSSENIFHLETLRRLNLLRRFLPNYEEFAIQGYGHMIWRDFLPHDDSIKTGIAKKYLTLEWEVSINANFSGLGNLAFRHETWAEYAKSIMEIRKAVIKSLKQLQDGIQTYFIKNTFIEIKEEVNLEEWESCKKLLNSAPFLPRVAVDEWGFSTESTLEADERFQKGNNIKRNILSLQKYNLHVKTFREYTQTLSNFFTQALDGIILQPYLGRVRGGRVSLLKVAQTVGVNRNNPNLATYNFSEAIKNLHQFQENLRNILQLFFTKDEIEQIESEEKEIFNKVFPTWYFFAKQPQKVLRNATEWSIEQTKQILGEIRQHLKQKLNRISSKKTKINIISESILWEKESALWITINSENLSETYNSFVKVLNIIKESVSKVPNDRLRYYILDLYWSNIVIIPLIKDRYIKPVAWRINIHTLTNEDFFTNAKWWSFAQLPIPDEALQELKLSALDLPNTQIVENLLSYSSILYALTGHIKDFLRLPAIDSEGSIILQNYVNDLSSDLSKTITSLLNEIENLAGELNKIPIEECNQTPDLIELGEIIIDFRQYVAPFISFEEPNEENNIQIFQEMNLNDLSDWADSLEKAQLYALSIYSIWVSYIVIKEYSSQILK